MYIYIYSIYSYTNVDIDKSSMPNLSFFLGRTREFSWKALKDMIPDPSCNRRSVGGLLPRDTFHLTVFSDEC